MNPSRCKAEAAPARPAAERRPTAAQPAPAEVLQFQHWLLARPDTARGGEDGSGGGSGGRAPIAGLWARNDAAELAPDTLDQLGEVLADRLDLDGAEAFQLQLPRLGTIDVRACEAAGGLELQLAAVEPATRQWLAGRRQQLARRVGERLGRGVRLEVQP
ncbi:type III secretion system HrpP C-terminal domain-containing protein [Chitinimonas koreensis]|uniref:type III secretion system HrpP C-terminal domain-containing protein n=1 Tax=Chitinimonas koreensis TaxID=356302 RepID=UPI000423A3A1|nr:type III secretion system HrpP C-terminal domain-containing protein [Chitinimonas koreensis]QNM97643.1 hypothetical protein H9L41_04910 [Chitinimonas koreensis]